MSCRQCSSCAYIIKRNDGTFSCQVTNPGQTTEISDPTDEDMSCPKWENSSFKAATQKKRNSREEVILYDIIR